MWANVTNFLVVPYATNLFGYFARFFGYAKQISQ